MSVKRFNQFRCIFGIGEVSGKWGRFFGSELIANGFDSFDIAPVNPDRGAFFNEQLGYPASDTSCRSCD